MGMCRGKAVLFQWVQVSLGDRSDQGLPLRGCLGAAHTGPEMVCAQGLGTQGGKAGRLQEDQGRRRAQARSGYASPVARCNRLHLVKQGDCGLEETRSQNFA